MSLHLRETTGHSCSNPSLLRRLEPENSGNWHCFTFKIKTSLSGVQRFRFLKQGEAAITVIYFKLHVLTHNKT